MKTKKPVEQQPHPSSVFVEDPFPTAAIITIDPEISATAEPTFSGRVGFRLEGDEARIKAAFQALSADHPIGARSLIENIKRLRTEMFRLKASGQGGHR